MVASAGGFGTVTEDGYGVSYIVANEDIGKLVVHRNWSVLGDAKITFRVRLSLHCAVNFSVHSRRSCPSTDSTAFGNAICKAMDDLKELYQKELQS